MRAVSNPYFFILIRNIIWWVMYRKLLLNICIPMHWPYPHHKSSSHSKIPCTCQWRSHPIKIHTKTGISIFFFLIFFLFSYSEIHNIMTHTDGFVVVYIGKKRKRKKTAVAICSYQWGRNGWGRKFFVCLT